MIGLDFLQLVNVDVADGPVFSIPLEHVCVALVELFQPYFEF
jgi:hypothetical protein